MNSYFGVAAIFVIKQISGEVMMIVANMTDIAVRHSHYQCINRIDEGSSHHLRPFLATNSANIYTAAAVLAGQAFLVAICRLSKPRRETK